MNRHNLLPDDAPDEPVRWDRYELSVGSFDQVLVMCGSCDAGGKTPTSLIVASYPVCEHAVPFRDAVEAIQRHEREEH